MADLSAFKNELSLIVTDLAKAVLTATLTAMDKVSANKQNPQTEDKLSTLVDSLCVQAVDKILTMVELAAEKQEETPGDLQDPPGDPKDPPKDLNDPPGDPKDPPKDLNDPPGDPKDPPGDLQDPPGDLRDSPESEESSECLTKRTEGGGGGGERPPTGQTYVLLYQGAAAGAKSLLLSLQGPDNADGEDKTVSMDVTRETTASPPPRADVSDHEYARLPPPLPAISACSRKQRCSSDKKIEPIRPPTKTPDVLCQCLQCGMLFPNAERLLDHHRRSHPVCSVCGAELTSTVKLREHLIREHGQLPHGCDYCPKRFNHKTHRDLHVKARHTGEKTCHCDICGKGYSCVSMMKTHRMTHFEKTFTCDVCSKSFYHSGHLKRHKLMHQEVRPFQCSTCGKGFNQAANLRTHQAIHTGERQLCSICGKSFRFLKNHVISKHSHELPTDELPNGDAIITCEVCGKRFPHPSLFKIHHRSHTGEKPFPCDVCGKSYRLRQQLRDHRYTHSGEKPYKCTLCSKTFNLSTSFMRHRSIHSGETPYSCLDCGKHFRLFTFLKAHMQTKAHLKQAQQRQTATSDL